MTEQLKPVMGHYVPPLSKPPQDMRNELLNQWGDPVEVLDGGFVRLVDVMGDDSSIVQAARISYGAGTKTHREDRGLIRYMMRHEHMTPFEMCTFKIHVKAPISVARQWFRHRTFSFNEFSTRYSVVTGEPYRTKHDAWRGQSKTNKQGSGQNFNYSEGHVLSKMEDLALETAQEEYKNMVELGVAREQARRVLPLATWTEFYMSGNLRNLLHFLGLRMDEHAQIEIRSYANQIGKIVAHWVPTVWEAFNDYHTHRDAYRFSSQELDLLGHILGVGMDQHGVDPEATPEDYGMSLREWNEFWSMLESIRPGTQDRYRPEPTLSFQEIYPDGIGGRFKSDGPNSGEEFRDDYLIPALKRSHKVHIDVRNMWGFPPSTAEEIFGGLMRKVRDAGQDPRRVSEKIKFISDANSHSEVYLCEKLMKEELDRGLDSTLY